MRILWEEIKKIWRLPIVTAVLIVNFLLFYLLMSNMLNHSFNERGELMLLSDLRGLVGETLEPEELPAVYQLLDDYYDVVTAIMQTDGAYAEAGLTDGRELWTITSQLPDETDEEAETRFETHWCLADEFCFGKYLEPSRYAFWKIGSLTRFLEEYERFETRDFSDYYADYEIPADRLAKFAETNAYYNLFSSWSYEDTVNYLSMCSVFAVISIAFLLLPYLVTDNQRGMPQMQWSTKSGRGILKTQFAAAILSAFALIIALYAVYFGLFLAHRQEYFTLLNRHIFSCLGHTHALAFNPPFGLLIATALALCAALGIGAAGIFTFLSYHSYDYVSELLKAVSDWLNNF